MPTPPSEGATTGSKRVVVFGGGTGISASLRGIKTHTNDLTAIVTVADDGGSSGRLRKDYHMLPPGDIRNCLVALSDGDPLLGDLFNYRFEDSILRGHSFGNLFLAVLTRLTGEFRAAVEQARRLLGVRGQVIPSTDTRVVLVASHPDGTRSTGEQCISKCGKPITAMELKPPPPPISDEIAGILAEADLVLLGPGSLFTSIIPNLLVPGMADAIEACPGLVVLVANLMTQPGETDGFDLRNHVRTLKELGGLERIDHVIVNTAPVATEVRDRYREAGAEILVIPEDTTELDGTPVVPADLVTLTDEGMLRHDHERLALALLQIVVRPREESGS